MRKQSHTKLSLLIALDLCQAPYQVLLMIYLKDFILVSVWIVNLDYMVFKDDQLIFRCFECKKNNKDFNKEFIKRFANICEFCNGGINKFILLLRKSVYPYEYIESWVRFDEASLPDKEALYSSLNMEDITDRD